MSGSLLQINRARFRSDLAALAGIGRDENTQILSRRSNSEAAGAAQRWLQRRVATALLQPSAGFEETVVAALTTPQSAPGLVIVGGMLSDVSDRPVVGSFALIAGLECLRCLKESKTELNAPLALALTMTNATTPSVTFSYADNELLRQAQRLIGLEIHAGATLSMRETCEMAQACGISALPLPTPNESGNPKRTQTYKFILDAKLANWPIENWDALEASANLLLNLVSKFAAAS